jgi:antitoxin (DNA-binding transcriptional repressor) of toxin-antitoxin stability system
MTTTMQRSYNIHEAKTNLSRLLNEMAGGAQVIIMRDGKPVAQLAPYREPQRKKRRLGFDTLAFELPEGWERPMTDAEVDAFLAGKL